MVRILPRCLHAAPRAVVTPHDRRVFVYACLYRRQPELFRGLDYLAHTDLADLWFARPLEPFFRSRPHVDLALMRETLRICGETHVDVIAVAQNPMPDALVYRLEDDALGELAWEGLRVLVGRRAPLVAALGARAYDLAIALSIEENILSLAFELRAHVRVPRRILDLVS